MKIAVIGSGVSGLVAARLLSKCHEVTLFEADSRLGGHVNTVVVPGTRDAIDTGFIVYNQAYYPGFVRLLHELGVMSQPTTMSLSVRDDVKGVEYSGASLNSLFAQRKNLTSRTHWRLLRDISRFVRAAEGLSSSPLDFTVKQYLQQSGSSEQFASSFLVPFGASLWSSPKEAFLEFPIRFVAGFMKNHGMAQFLKRPSWRVVQGGSQTYVKKLLADLQAHVRVGDAVLSIERGHQGVKVVTQSSRETFDEVVVACHADQALKLIAQPTLVESELLGAFRYQKNETVLHTDKCVMPKLRRAWGSWNYKVSGDGTLPGVTYYMNMLQNLAIREHYFVSLNSTEQLDPSKIIATFYYDHPIASVVGLGAQARRAELIRHDRVSYCGAYWGYGFHEDGLQSAVQVGKAFGVDF